MYLLHTQIGLAFLAGVGVALLLIPINQIIAKKISQLSVKLMVHKDERVRVIGEILRGFRVIKMNVWEEYFMKKVMGS